MSVLDDGVPSVKVHLFGVETTVEVMDDVGH
jgi:hypothetical protein